MQIQELGYFNFLPLNETFLCFFGNFHSLKKELFELFLTVRKIGFDCETPKFNAMSSAIFTLLAFPGKWRFRVCPFVPVILYFFISNLNPGAKLFSCFNWNFSLDSS